MPLLSWLQKHVCLSDVSDVMEAGRARLAGLALPRVGVGCIPWPVKPFETITVIKGYTYKMDSAATQSS